MNTIIEKELEFLVLGDAQTRGRAALVPLLRPEPANGPEYLMLSEALQQGLLRVTEVSEGGAVPELKVTNEDGFPVLLIDGEELAGAKQNRVPNTSILIKEAGPMPPRPSPNPATSWLTRAAPRRPARCTSRSRPAALPSPTRAKSGTESETV